MSAPLMSGFLSKRNRKAPGFLTRTWDYRFFVLDDKALSYSHSKAAPPAALFPVPTLLACEDLGDGKFEAKFEEKTLLLQAEGGARDARKWVDAIKQARWPKRATDTPPAPEARGASYSPTSPLDAAAEAAAPAKPVDSSPTLVAALATAASVPEPQATTRAVGAAASVPRPPAPSPAGWSAGNGVMRELDSIDYDDAPTAPVRAPVPTAPSPNPTGRAPRAPLPLMLDDDDAAAAAAAIAADSGRVSPRALLSRPGAAYAAYGGDAPPPSRAPPPRLAVSVDAVRPFSESESPGPSHHASSPGVAPARHLAPAVGRSPAAVSESWDSPLPSPAPAPPAPSSRPPPAPASAAAAAPAARGVPAWLEEDFDD